MTIQLDVVSRRLSHSNARFLLILIPVVIFIGVYSFYSDHSGTPTTVEKVMGEPMKENLPPLKTFKTKDLLPLNDNKPKSKEQVKLQLTSAEMASNIGRKEDEKEEEKAKEDVDVEKENTEDAHDKDFETESSKDKEIHKSKEQSEKQDELREVGDDKEEFHPKDISTSLKKGKSTEVKLTTEEKEIKGDNDKDEVIEKKEEDTAKTDAVEEHTENKDNTSTLNRRSKEIIMKKEEEPSLPKSSEKKNIDEITVDKVVDNAKEHMEEKIEKGKSKEEITVERIDLNKKYYDKSSGKLKSRETGKTNSKEEETPEETEKPDDDSLVA